MAKKVPTLDEGTNKLLSKFLPVLTTADLSDVTAVGEAVVTAADAPTARTAIGAGTSSFSGAYTDLSSKPTIPATPADIGAASATGGARESVAALSATTGTATGNLNNASVFTVTPTGNITLAFSNVPASGTACTATVIVTQGATVRTVALPSGGVWLGAAPTQTASKACVITLLTTNGGTTWYASAAVQA